MPIAGHFGCGSTGAKDNRWARNFSLDVVSDATPVTEISPPPRQQSVLPKQPINLRLAANTA